MSTILTGINDGERRIHIKGAAEIVVKSCTHYINKQGERNLMTKEMIFRLDEVMSQFGENSLRMIGMAYKDIEERVVINVEPNFEERFDIEEADFTLIGIIGIGDKV